MGTHLLLKPAMYVGDDILSCQGALSQVKAFPKERLAMPLDGIVSLKIRKDLWE